MAADFEDEFPHFRTSFDILKTESIVLSIQFSPDDECVYGYVRNEWGKE
jgi:hypothetical protein